MFTQDHLHRRSYMLGLLALTMFLSAACAPVRPAGTPVAATPVSATSAAPRVYFAEPQDGATVAAPVKVVMAAESFTVEPASATVTAGHGHLHIMVDTDCVAAGQGVPKDKAHMHFGQGQLEAELELAPGAHALCLQAADGLHVALPGEGMTQKIAITVE